MRAKGLKKYIVSTDGIRDSITADTAANWLLQGVKNCRGDIDITWRYNEKLEKIFFETTDKDSVPLITRIVVQINSLIS